MNKESKRFWWIDSHDKDNANRSPWLKSTLAEFKQRAIAMLNIIQEDADSFAKRAEMYYKKRPELISMVEELYRSHRSLAERFDRMKSEPQTCSTTPQSSSPSSPKHSLDKSLCLNDKVFDNFSDEASEVDDPEEDQERLQDHVIEEVSNGASNEELMILKEDIERLREENGALREQLMLKDEEKRGVIRQLSLSMEMLLEERLKLKQYLAKRINNQHDQQCNLKEGFFTRVAVPWICKIHG